MGHRRSFKRCQHILNLDCNHCMISMIAQAEWSLQHPAESLISVYPSSNCASFSQAWLMQIVHKRAEHTDPLWEEYIPCHCPDGCGDDCSCFHREQFCKKFCACSTACTNGAAVCKHFFKGCNCSGGCRTKICPCLAAGKRPDIHP